MHDSPISPIPSSGKVLTHVAARIIGLAESTLRYYRHANKGPVSYLIGTKVYYDVADIEEWLAAQKKATSRGDATS